MVRETLTARVERLKGTASHLASLPARFGAVERELAEFRAEVRLEFAAVRAEMRAGGELLRYELRADMRSGHETCEPKSAKGMRKRDDTCACFTKTSSSASRRSTRESSTFASAPDNASSFEILRV
jgi:hypothetical protein